MRYIIKERIFSLSNRFRIDSMDTRDSYEVVGRFLSFGKKLKVYDSRGDEVAYIREKLFRILPEYTIQQNGRRTGRLKKKMTILRPKFHISSSYGNFSLEGDIMHHDFRIVKNRKPVAWISKKWVSLSDTYTVEIGDDIDHAFILSIVIILDQIFYDGKKNANNNNNMNNNS